MGDAAAAHGLGATLIKSTLPLIGHLDHCTLLSSIVCMCGVCEWEANSLPGGLTEKIFQLWQPLIKRKYQYRCKCHFHSRGGRGDLEI